MYISQYKKEETKRYALRCFYNFVKNHPEIISLETKKEEMIEGIKDARYAIRPYYQSFIEKPPIIMHPINYNYLQNAFQIQTSAAILDAVADEYETPRFCGHDIIVDDLMLKDYIFIINFNTLLKDEFGFEFAYHKRNAKVKLI